jgi:hypothetical protein
MLHVVQPGAALGVGPGMARPCHRTRDSSISDIGTDIWSHWVVEQWSGYANERCGTLAALQLSLPPDTGQLQLQVIACAV